MSQAVVIKSNKYGIHLVLSNEISTFGCHRREIQRVREVL